MKWWIFDVLLVAALLVGAATDTEIPRQMVGALLLYSGFRVGWLARSSMPGEGRP